MLDDAIEVGERYVHLHPSLRVRRRLPRRRLIVEDAGGLRARHRPERRRHEHTPALGAEPREEGAPIVLEEERIPTGAKMRVLVREEDARRGRQPPEEDELLPALVE